MRGSSDVMSLLCQRTWDRVNCVASLETVVCVCLGRYVNPSAHAAFRSRRVMRRSWLSSWCVWSVTTALIVLMSVLRSVTSS